MKLNAPADTGALAATLAASLARERRQHVVWALALALGLSAIAPRTQATAVFNRQTGQPCAACHTAPPELTPLGRRFKLGGYTMRGGERGVPLSAFVQAGYTATSQDVTTPAPGLDANHNLDVQRVKLLAGGALGDSTGAFAELVWNPVAGRTQWGNLDMRYADSRSFGEQGEQGEHDLLYGITVNNNPGFQDPWNSTPVRSWPYTRSAAAPQPRNVPLLDGPLAQRSLGLGMYGFIDDEWYIELAGYGGLDRSQQEALGVDPGEFRTVRGLARYGRIAHERKLGGGHSLTLGASVFVSELSRPGARLPGTDAVRILGADLLYQWAQGPHEATLRAAAGSERWDTTDSVAQGLALNERQPRPRRPDPDVLCTRRWPWVHCSAPRR
jgi:hypothetical protein